MPTKGYRSFAMNLSVEGRLGGAPFIYLLQADIEVPIVFGEHVVTGLVSDYWSEREIEFFQSEDGWFKGWLPYGSADTHVLLDEYSLTEILSWRKAPVGGVRGHPLGNLHFSYREDGPHSDGFSPPEWHSDSRGQRHGGASYFYGGGPRMAHWAQRERVVARPLTIDQMGERGRLVERADEDSILLVVQERINRKYALLDGVLMERTIEPRWHLTTYQEGNGDRVAVRMADGDASIAKPTEPICFEYPLSRHAEVDEIAMRIAGRTGDSHRRSTVFTTTASAVLTLNSDVANWRRLACVWGGLVGAAAARMPDAALRVFVEMQQMLEDKEGTAMDPLMDAWLDVWERFDEALGDLASGFHDGDRHLRRLHMAQEAVRFGMRPLKEAPTKPTIWQELPADEYLRTIIEKSARHLALGGKDYSEAWMALRSASSESSIHIAAARLLRSPPAGFSTLGAMNAWHSKFVPDLMQMAGVHDRPSKRAAIITEQKRSWDVAKPMSFYDGLRRAPMTPEIAKEFGVACTDDLVRLYNEARAKVDEYHLPWGSFPSSPKALRHLASLTRTALRTAGPDFRVLDQQPKGKDAAMPAVDDPVPDFMAGGRSHVPGIVVEEISAEQLPDFLAEDESPRHRVEPKKRASDMSNAALEALRPLLRRAEDEGWDATRLQATVVAVMDDYVETKQKLSALLNL